jgi:hypothetical protein
MLVGAEHHYSQKYFENSRDCTRAFREELGIWEVFQLSTELSDHLFWPPVISLQSYGPAPSQFGIGSCKFWIGSCKFWSDPLDLWQLAGEEIQDAPTVFAPSQSEDAMTKVRSASIFWFQAGCSAAFYTPDPAEGAVVDDRSCSSLVGLECGKATTRSDR